MNENRIVHAAHAIRNGKLIVYPTDTLYALGADATQKNAIRSLFSIKNRPFTLPLPIAVSDMKMLNDVVYLSTVAKQLADTFFPGKITLVCRKKNIILDEVTAGKNTVAVRIPDDSIALELIKKTGPIVTTSANIHGHSTPSTISEIRKLFKPGIVEVYIDDGLRQNKPSTIVDVTSSQPKILRQGAISKTIIFDEVNLNE